ncbi:MAG: zf-HC2 domain-containing protein [Bryobacteraceae bacterium]|jgi:anti-sigma factor RsiW
MSCDNVRDRISLLLDHRTVGGERETMLAHLAGCEACGARYESLRDMKRVMGRMSRTPVPPDVEAKLRALAARERARQLSRLSHGSRLSYWAGRLRMEFENLMRPMALPFAGGVCAALLAFGMLVPNLSFAHHLSGDDPAVSLPTNPDGKVVGAIGEIPRVESIDASQAESATSDGTVVELTIDQKGRVRYYSVVRGQLTRDMESIILFSYFTPATFFGQPTWGKVRVSLLPIRNARS